MAQLLELERYQQALGEAETKIRAGLMVGADPRFNSRVVLSSPESSKALRFDANMFQRIKEQFPILADRDIYALFKRLSTQEGEEDEEEELEQSLHKGLEKS